MSNLSWTQPHTPCNRCVRFATTVASGHATLATKQDATLYLGRTFTGWIAPAFGWRTHSITSSAIASSEGRARRGACPSWGVGSETRTPRTIASFGRIALEALSRAASNVGSRRMIRCKRAFLSFHQLSFLFDPVDSFYTAGHMRMRDSAY